MPRDAVTITDLALNGGVAAVAGTTIAPANGAVIDTSGYKGRKLVVEVTNTAVADKVATVKAGANPPAWRAGLGDLALTVPANTGDVLVCLESSRFLQADGKINIDFGAAMTGAVKCYALPAGA